MQESNKSEDELMNQGSTKENMASQEIERYWKERDQIYKSFSKEYEGNQFCKDVIECFQNLNDSFAERLKASDYTDDEVANCMTAMDRLINIRLLDDKDIKTDIVYDESDYEKMNADEMRKQTLSELRELQIFMVKSNLSFALLELKIPEMKQNGKTAIRNMEKKLKEHPEIADMTLDELEREDPFEDYDFELCCTRSTARKLEDLMETEYPEFDEFLGRKEDENKGCEDMDHTEADDGNDFLYGGLYMDGSVVKLDPKTLKPIKK